MDDRAAGALYLLASGRCHEIGNGRSLIAPERATVDRKITLRIDVGDVAVACGVWLVAENLAIVVECAAIDGRPPALIHVRRIGTDEQQTPIGLLAETELVRAIATTADGNAGIAVHV